MSSKLQLEVCQYNKWWHRLVNAYVGEKVSMVLFAGKMCDPYLSELRVRCLQH